MVETTPAAAEPASGEHLRVMVIGSGFHFTSGVSYYTCSVANELARDGEVDVLLMRRLIPRVLYPGRARVGRPVHRLQYAPEARVYDGVDWYWGRSMTKAIEFIESQRPDVVVFQWWTGAVLHSYRRLARCARGVGARILIEWHEVQDTGEVRIPAVRRYVERGMQRLLPLVDGHVVHSRYDLGLLSKRYALPAESVEIVGHGPYPHVAAAAPAPRDPGGPTKNLLYFGVIRPYKGVRELVQAFEALPESEAAGLRLTIVGETWEGCEDEVRAALDSPRRDRITVVNRYVTDEELSGFVAAADVVVLPYRRSSSSGPLHIAMSAGRAVVVTDVGGIAEAVEGYAGAVLVPPADVGALARGLLAGRDRAAEGPFADPKSWADLTRAYRRLARRPLGTAAGVPA